MNTTSMWNITPTCGCFLLSGVYFNKLDIGCKDFIHNFTIRLNCDFWLGSTMPFFNDFKLYS